LRMSPIRRILNPKNKRALHSVSQNRKNIDFGKQSIDIQEKASRFPHRIRDAFRYTVPYIERPFQAL
jgi:hypothetical protein